MANKVTFDYSLTENVISADEIKSMEKITNDAKELLLSKEGAGSDFFRLIMIRKNSHVSRKLLRRFSLIQKCFW